MRGDQCDQGSIKSLDPQQEEKANTLRAADPAVDFTRAKKETS